MAQGVAPALAGIQPGAEFDPEAIAAAQAQAAAFMNPPAPPPLQAPPGFVTPAEAAQIPGLAFQPVGLPDAQAQAAALQAPAPPPVVAPSPLAPPPPAAGPPLSAPVAAAVAHAGGGPSGALKVPSPDAEIAGIQRTSEATQSAILQQGEAQAAESTAEAEARRLGEEHMGLAREHLRETQAQRDTAVRAINEDQQRVYDEAHAATIPDFFEGRHGAKAIAAISVALGEAGRGLLAFGTGANVGNTAKDIIDRQISQFYTRKKEEVDNLFKYAAARNQLGEQEKAQWATKLNDIQFELAATHQAMADHILEVAAQSKGRINQAAAKVAAADQAQKAQQLETKARDTNFNNQVSARHLGISAFEAQTGRIRALQDKQAAVEIKIGTALDSDMATLEKRIAKPREALGKIDDIVTRMDEAYAAHDANALAAAVVALKEGVGPLFAGGKTTGNLTKQLETMGTTKDEIQKTLGKLTGGNTVGDTQFKRLRELAIIGAQEKAQAIGGDRQAYMRKYLGPNGAASTPALKQKFLNDLNGITSEVKIGGQPIFQEGGAPEHVMQAAPTAALPPGAIPGTMNGRRGYVLNGQFVAQ